MRAVFCGLLLATLCAFVCSQGHDHHGDHDHHGSQDVTEAPTTAAEPEPVCLTENRTLEDLKQQLLNLQGCYTDKGNDLRPLINDTMGNKTNGRLEAIRTCFSNYVSNVSDCYSDAVPMWNTSIKMLQDVEDYLCDADGICTKLQDFYAGAGTNCGNTSDASSCGSNTMTMLLFETSFKKIVTDFTVLDYTSTRCEQESRVGTCVIDKLKTCVSDKPIADIAQGLHKTIMAATCGVSCLIQSSVTVWIFLAALLSAQRLLVL